MMKQGLFFFFNDTATTEIYTLSLHDALPISQAKVNGTLDKIAHRAVQLCRGSMPLVPIMFFFIRSEEHTSELQSRQYLVCRLLLEKKKQNMFKRVLYSTKANMSRVHPSRYLT